MKTSSILKGEPFPSKKVKSSNLQKTDVYSENHKGFLRSNTHDHMLACIGLSVLNIFHKLEVGGQQPRNPSIRKTILDFLKGNTFQKQSVV